MRRIARIVPPGSLLALCLFAAAGVATAGEEGAPAGQDLWRSCSACHCVPDARIPEDADWLKLVETTTCISGENDTPAKRKALIGYLRAEGTIRPRMIDERHAPAEGATVGRVRVPATAGSAYLKAERKSVREGAPPKIRLRWSAREKGTVLSIPVGDYRVISYSFHRTDDRKRKWTAAGSSAEGAAELKVRQDKEAALDLVPEIRANLSCKQGKSGFAFGFFMTDGHGKRMSLARDGNLMNPAWIVRKADGEEFDRGAFVVS